MVAAGFLRLATNPRVFVAPTSIAAATAFLDSLLSVTGVDMPELGREWPTLRQPSAIMTFPRTHYQCLDRSRGETLGSHLVTFDRGFMHLLGRTELTVLKPA